MVVWDQSPYRRRARVARATALRYFDSPHQRTARILRVGRSWITFYWRIICHDSSNDDPTFQINPCHYMLLSPIHVSGVDNFDDTNTAPRSCVLSLIFNTAQGHVCSRSAHWHSDIEIISLIIYAPHPSPLASRWARRRITHRPKNIS